jgi:hypothetical protein
MVDAGGRHAFAGPEVRPEEIGPECGDHHAKMAPKGPGAMAKVRGNENMPESTIEPTTIAVRANKESAVPAATSNRGLNSVSQRLNDRSAP